MDVDSLEENKQLFLQSCKDGSLATVQQLLTHSDLRAHIDSLTDDDGNTALIVASENGHKGIVKLLLECGVNVDKKTPGGWTALMKASERGDSNLEVIDLLLRYGAQADLQNNEGDSALIVATQNRQTELVIKLVRDHRANVDLKNNKGWTTLMKASQVGYVEVVELLLNHGAEVDQQTSDGYSALMLASQNGHIRLVKLLLKFHAKVDIKANNSKTALVLASQQKHTETVELLLEYGAKDNLDITLAYVAAIKEVHINTVKLLLELKAQVNYRQWGTLSALEGASENGRIDIVKLLLDHGSHEFLGLAVERASRNGHIYIVKLLLEHGADNLGWALVEAILNKHDDITELLLKYGAKVDEDDWFGILDEPPLVKAVEKGDTDMVKLLLEHGAKQEMGWAITEAIRNEHAEIVQLLSERGAQVDDDDRFEDEILDEPALVTASMNGNSNVVKLLLEHGVKKYLGWAITEAIRNEHAEIVQLLSERGAQVDDDDRFEDGVFDKPTLVTASMNGNSNIVKLLLEHGAKKYLGWALTEATWNEHDKIIQLLLEHGAQLDNDDWLDYFMFDEPPLVTASVSGNTNIVKLLLEHGAKKHLGWALTVATWNEHDEIIQLLLEHGAQVDNDDWLDYFMLDKPPLITASISGNTNIVKLLLEHGAKKHLGWALTEAIKHKHIEVTKVLLERGVSVDEINDDDRTPLIEASENGHIDIIKLLLEYGANIDKRNLKGWTALMKVSEKGDSNLEVIELLLRYGAQADLQNNEGDSALIVATQNSQTELVIKLVRDHRSNVHLKNNKGWTTLMKVSQVGCAEVVELLLNHGAEVDQQNSDGQTALMIASQNGHIKIVRLLIKFHAKVDIKANNSKTALVLASQQKHTETVELLLEYGAKDNLDITLAYVAAIKEVHINTVKLLLELKAQVNYRQWGTLSALEGASENGRIDIVKLLLDHGSHKFLHLAVARASRNGHLYIVKLLLEHGADYLGWALAEAILNKHDVITELLLKYGAKVDEDDWFGIFNEPPLIKAVEKGNTDMVKLLLEHGAKQEMGWAITEAIRNEHAEIVQLLSERGAQVDDDHQFEDEMLDQPALVTASMNGNSNIVKLLLEHGAKKYLGWALTEATWKEHDEIIQLLLEHGAQVDDDRFDYFMLDEPPLVAASISGNTNIVKLLLEHGAKKHLGWALTEAIKHKHIEVAKVLLERGVSVDEINDDDRTPLIEASQNGHTDVVKLLLDKGAQIDIASTNGWTALTKASQNGHTDVVILLLDKGAKVNIANIDGWNALMIASLNGHRDVVKLLLDRGTQIDIAETDGWTALMLASQDGHTDVVKLLLDKGARVDTASIEEETALMIASQNGHIDVVKLLLDKGAQDQQDNDRVTALMLASQEGHTNLVRLLLQHDSNAQLQDKNGSHALMKASHNGHTDAVKLLLNYEAQVDLQDYDGWSPLMKASQTGHTDIVKLLLEHNAQVNLQSQDGYYALMAASEEGYIEVVKQLLKHGSQVDLKDNAGRTAFTVAENTEILLAFALNTDAPSLDDIPPNDTQQDLHDVKDRQEHLIAIENAIRDGGELDHTLVHGVFVGPPRSGKDSLMRRLLGEKMTTDGSPSTGVAENVVHVKVEESSTFAATVELSNWTRLAYDEEAIHLMKTASNKSSNINQLHKETSDENVIAQSIELTPKEIEKTSQQIQERSAQINMKSSEESLMSEFMSPLEEIFQTPAHPDSQLSNKHKSPMEIFKEAIKNKGLEGFRKQLLKSWSLYLTNTGGQMEFQELLPLLVSGPSIFFITFQLHKDLNQHFSVEYELPSGKSSQSYQSSLSILESILQTLSSISAMGTYVYKGLQRKAVPLRPKVFIIGTHKDLLDKRSAKTEIQSIDEHLQAVLKSTSHYHEGIVQFASESQMMFDVNNHDLDDSDFRRIRSAVEKVVETGDYRMRSPAHWMIYSLVVRQLKTRVESYDECFAIAKECGIRDMNEFNEALHFIHTKMGLVRYFPHEQLKDLVIVDPQILFEKVTELIVETFTFDNVCKLKHSNLEIFKNMGIFNLSDFTRISSRTGQNLTPPLFAKLLEYLRIAAKFQQGGKIKYFLPCVLTHTQVKHYTPASTLPQLIVTFQCGYCPKGLFGTLVTYLINNEMQSDFEWELVTEKIYRDEVCFQVGPYDIITLRFLPTHIEIICVESNPDLPRINCTEESVCQEIYQSVEKGIKTVTSAINYINAQYSFTFYCTSESCSKELHPAKLKQHKGKLCSLKCDKLNKCFSLPSGFEKWQLDSSPQVFEPTKTTTSTSQPTESEIRLEKHHHTLLFGQLSGHASKWREIGIYLGFLNNELENIETKPNLFHGAPKSFLCEMLSEWLEWAPGDQRGSEQYATLEALKTAVSNAGLGATAANLTISGVTTGSTMAESCTTTNRDHDLSLSASTSAMKSGNKRNQESMEEPHPKRSRLE